MTMGERLKQLRLQRNISQEEVARTIGITRSAYSHYEINNRQPVYETLLKLSTFFEVSLDYIVGGDAFASTSQDTQEIMNMLNTMDHTKRKNTINLMLDVLKQSNNSAI
ncbi:transcriptional regulator [Paenibacillus selenitireducens]|jgi:transcriptional regulator with XRE-family HTH domain|uniref:Transcriptional regulator n=1 Tax=Paenibacillus selenitireducens TaxID=1324314 RepID=A0A1T2X033_9BACL|nr:helix-turn-helix transcriptional regulator [Paenibacillus selenitireducens]OPA73240.1 transcriptional regulator [Paenibacillus selenitireducens]